VIRVGDLVVPADEIGVVVRPVIEPRFDDHRQRDWLPDQPALVISIGHRMIGEKNYVRKLQVLLDGELGWVSEVWVRRIGG
jgi:hypothetical protein